MRNKYSRSLHYVATGCTGRIFRIYIAPLCGWGKPQRTFHPRSKLPLSRIVRRWIGWRTPTRIFGHMISRTARKRKWKCFGTHWNLLRIMQCAEYLAIPAETSSRDSLFADTFFFYSPWRFPLLFSLFISRLFSREVHFLANSTNLCITSPAICRANKSGRDNILIDL